MKYLVKNKYWEINKEYNLDKLLYLLIDRPTEIDDFTIEWRNNLDYSHRDYNLPSFIAVETENKCNSLYWDFNNKLHRENNKPAVIYSDGKKEYWGNGNFISEVKQNEISNNK